MKNKILILLVVVFSVLNGVAQEDKSLGKLYLDDLQFNQARDFFQKTLKSSPNDIWAYCSLGEAYIGLQKLDSAKMMYQKAFTIDPKNPMVLIGLGKMALLNDDHEAEVDYFDKARRQDKKNPRVYWKIAEACYDLSKKDTITGNQYLTQGMELNSKFPGFHMVMGDWEAYKKNYGKAANAYERAIYFDPNSILAHRKLGEIYADARFNRQALDEYNKCIEIDPNQILVYKDLGDLYYSLGRYAEAEKNYKIYMSKAEVTLDDKERYGLILFFNRKYKEAADLLEDVQSKKADESVLLRIRGYIAYETGEYQKGVDYMKKFFDLHNPSKIITSDYMYYARLLQKTGQDIPAMENFKKALAMDSTQTEIYGYLAQLAANNMMHAQAAHYYQEMIDHGADKITNYYAIGKEDYFEGYSYKAKFDSLYNLQKKENIPFSDSTAVRDTMRIWYQKADSAFTKVTELDSTYYGGFLWKGRMASRLDPESETGAAREAYQKALALLLKGDVEKNDRMIIECYKYLASDAFLNYERLKKTDKEKAKELLNATKDYFQKVLEVDPSDKQAIESLDLLKKVK